MPRSYYPDKKYQEMDDEFWAMAKRRFIVPCGLTAKRLSEDQSRIVLDKMLAKLFAWSKTNVDFKDFRQHYRTHKVANRVGLWYALQDYPPIRVDEYPRILIEPMPRMTVEIHSKFYIFSENVGETVWLCEGPPVGHSEIFEAASVAFCDHKFRWILLPSSEPDHFGPWLLPRKDFVGHSRVVL